MSNSESRADTLNPPASLFSGNNIQYPNMSFDITHRDPNSHARLGQINTPHGSVQTPNFIFVGTKATVKNSKPGPAQRSWLPVRSLEHLSPDDSARL